MTRSAPSYPPFVLYTLQSLYRERHKKEVPKRVVTFGTSVKQLILLSFPTHRNETLRYRVAAAQSHIA